jgi:DNA-binding NtrC family response regulator
VNDLSLDVQSSLLLAITGARDSKHRYIVASRSSHSELTESHGILPKIADYWRDVIYIPSLYEHVEDIPELLEYYVNWYSDYEQLPYRHFGVAAQNLLRNYEWLGDILQLKQFVKTILGNSDNKIIEFEEIEFILKQFESPAEPIEPNSMQLTINLNMDLRDAREAFEREYLSRHLEMCGNNITELARRVGQERTNLYRKLKSLGLHNKK